MTQHDLTRQLLRKAREGDRTALDAVLERHRSALKRMVMSRLDRALQRRVDASDIVQDVLWQASQRLDEFPDDARVPFHIWLRGMARDRVIDMHRRHRQAARRSVDRERRLDEHRPDRPSHILARELADAEPTPGAEAIRNELQQRFRSAMAQLDDADREIIVMRHFEQRSNQEVADLLDLSPAAAGMRYLRALRRLRSMLDRMDDSLNP